MWSKINQVIEMFYSIQVKIISTVRPTEIYNLGAQSHVKVSFELAEYTAEVVGVGTLRLLDAIKTCGLEKQVRDIIKTGLIVKPKQNCFLKACTMFHWSDSLSLVSDSF